MEKEIVKEIRRIRESKGIKQISVAETLGISTTSYSKIERGDTKLTINHIEQIAKALGVSPYSFIVPSFENADEDITALKRENEALKKDIERYKGIVDTYQEKIVIADGLIDLMNHFKKISEERASKIENNERGKPIEIADVLKDFKM